METYPSYISLLNVIQNWNPDNPDPPRVFKETLQHFNYSNEEERRIAEIFRNAELPFKLYDIPEVDGVTGLWTDEYLAERVGDVRPKVEKSNNNHFMYWTHKKHMKDKTWKPPTEIVNDMPFTDWRALARAADENKLKNDSAHFYFMASSGVGGSKDFIPHDMPFFDPKYVLVMFLCFCVCMCVIERDREG